jgi:hypothetical protein
MCYLGAVKNSKERNFLEFCCKRVVWLKSIQAAFAPYLLHSNGACYLFNVVSNKKEHENVH